MFPIPQARPPAQPGPRRALLAGLAACLAALLSGCSGAGVSNSDLFSSQPPPPASEQTARNAIGSGQVRVGLVLPLSASGNAGLAGQSMRNAAELALAEFNNPNIQLLVKDDAGTAQGAQQAAQQALDEGAEIIIGPLFAHSVSQVGQVARARGVPVIAFSTDSNVAGRGVYPVLLRTEADYRRPAKLSDRLLIRGRMDRVERARFWCAFEVVRPMDDVLMVTCRQSLALIQMPEGKPLRLPEDWSVRFAHLREKK